MRIRGDVLTFAVWRRLAVQLLVVVLCLRALIPVGFMTDAQAAQNGVFRIVICAAHGSGTLVDLDFTNAATSNDSDEQKSSPSHDQPCAFASLAADLGGAIQAYTIVKPLAVDPARRDRPRHAVMPPARAGPVLGSRAPPSLS